MADRRLHSDISKAIETLSPISDITSLTENYHGDIWAEQAAPYPRVVRKNHSFDNTAPNSLYSEDGCKFRLQKELMNRAIEADHPELVEWIMSHGFDINCRSLDYLGNNPLHQACFLGRKRILEIFHKSKPNMLYRGSVKNEGLKSALSFLLHHDDVDLLRPWLDCLRQTPDCDGGSLLHTVVEEGAERCLRHIIAWSPALVHGCDISGFTPLLVAVRRGAPLVKELLENGASVHAHTTSNRYTPLHMLFLARHWLNGNDRFLPTDAADIAELLIGAGADVNALDSFFEMPLTLLCKHLVEDKTAQLPYSLDTLHTIIKKSAQILIDNGTDFSCCPGLTPQFAIMNQIGAALDIFHQRASYPFAGPPDSMQLVEFCQEMLVLLLRNGCDPNGVNQYDKTLLTCVIEEQHDSVGPPDVQLKVAQHLCRTVKILLLYRARICDISCIFNSGHESVSDHTRSIMITVLNAMPRATLNIQMCKLLKLRAETDTWVAMSTNYMLIEKLLVTTRTLKQLARCQVQTSVKGHLPDIVSNLPLPELLRDYVTSFEN